jgi:hypothetical protein
MLPASFLTNIVQFTDKNCGITRNFIDCRELRENFLFLARNEKFVDNYMKLKVEVALKKQSL